ncbi:hypothetical protein [Spirillospora albida]|uniref:hypothetical protein n=1 Tax=Spirillospora albida TaxID=58123 RepID=UPI001FE19C0E|nr:hypothetical protein [Spirillospora albida]
MFWRRQRAAMERFHPLHRALIDQRGFTVSLRRDDWEPVIRSLAGHGLEVKRRKWAPPPRTATVLVPLVRVLTADMRPEGVLSVAADLRGPTAPGKATPEQQLPVRHPVKSLKQWFVIDPWLRMRAELRDGSVLEFQVTDRIRHRKLRKTNPRGKIKFKRKSKTVQLVRVIRHLPKGAAHRRPDTPPPAWFSVRVKTGSRMVIRATGKFQGPVADPELTKAILQMTTEPFRWTPPGTITPRRKP